MLKKYQAELDIYSGIAILFVVILHSNAYYLSNVLKLSSYIEGGVWLNFIDKVVHIAVPMFIFIAGYKYMMNNQEDTYIKYFMKKMKNVFKPFFITSTFYLSYYWAKVFITRFIYTGVYDIQYVAQHFVIGFMRMFVGYNFAYQFWYIPMYLFICLSYPFFYKHLKNSYLRFILFISLAIIWEILVSMQIPYISNNPYPLRFIYYFFIYELGCIFYCYKTSKIMPIILTLLYIFLLIIVFTVKQPLCNRLIYELLFIPVSVITYYYIALLIKKNYILMLLGKYSFFIYLFHEPLVLSSLSRYLLKNGLYKSYFTTIFLTVLSMVISIIIYYLISKIFFKKPLYNKVSM